MGQKGREGKALHIVHVTLPLGVSLQINRWTEASEGDYINIRLTMPKQPNQDGHCGNFNGNTRMTIALRSGRAWGKPEWLQGSSCSKPRRPWYRRTAPT